jgi:hypothetical protein
MQECKQAAHVVKDRYFNPENDRTCLHSLHSNAGAPGLHLQLRQVLLVVSSRPLHTRQPCRPAYCWDKTARWLAQLV